MSTRRRRSSGRRGGASSARSVRCRTGTRRARGVPARPPGSVGRLDHGDVVAAPGEVAGGEPAEAGADDDDARSSGGAGCARRRGQRGRLGRGTGRSSIASTAACWVAIKRLDGCQRPGGDDDLGRGRPAPRRGRVAEAVEERRLRRPAPARSTSSTVRLPSRRSSRPLLPVVAGSPKTPSTSSRSWKAGPRRRRRPRGAPRPVGVAAGEGGAELQGPRHRVAADLNRATLRARLDGTGRRPGRGRGTGRRSPPGAAW